MPIQKKVTVYKFSELDAKVQDRVVDKESRSLHENFDSSSTSDLFKHRIEDDYGITNCEVFWRLNNCQGDGVAFVGRPDIALLAAKSDGIRSITQNLEKLGVDLGDISVDVTNHSNYSHWNSMSYEVEVPYYGNNLDESVNQENRDKVDDLANELEKEVKLHFQAASRTMESLGYDDIESQTSPEAARALLTDRDGETLYYRNGDEADEDFDEDDDDQ